MRSIKPGVAFLSFVLGISLLLYGAVGALYLITQADYSARYLSDAFQADYQNTVQFRSRIGGQLYSLLDYGANPDNYNGQSPLNKSDRNLLFQISKDGEVIDSNTSVFENGGTPPEEYNFLLYFDGQSVTIQKDGKEVDVYGDGFYRGLERSWYVPGYPDEATPFEPAYAHLTVSMAALKEPVDYGTGYSLYTLAEELSGIRLILIGLFIVPPLVGLALLILSIVWHKHKVRADQAIAWFTGHIWLEVKLLSLIPFVFLCAFAGICTIDLIVQNYYYGLFAYLSVPAVLWWFYLYINDVRYNFGQLRTHSFCAACARLLRRQELRLPISLRMERRSILQFALCVPFFLYCALQVPWLYNSRFYHGLWPLFLALVCLGAVALIAAQIYLMKRNRQTLRDLDTLLTRIQAAGEGQLDPSLPLPADSDLMEAAEQLEHMEAGLRSALLEQMKSERMKVELITNVSHDLKTPLTSIVSYTELLRQESGLPEHVQDYIRILSEKTARLQAMVQDVFEVSKATTGNLPVELKPIDFAKLLRQTLADMDEAITASSFTFRVQLPEAPVWILADGDRMYRVFQNLIANALKYSLEGTRIYLELKVDQGQSEAVLQNISRDELPSGTDFTARFVRGDESRSDGGSGLGLSIARSFTEACGGTFHVHTQADLFTVQVSFPLTLQRPKPEPIPAPEAADNSHQA